MNAKTSSLHSQIRNIILTSLLVLPVLGSGTANAGTASGTMTVNATIAATCTVNSPTLNLGTYDTVSGSAVDTGTTTLTVACTNGTGYTVTLGQGANAATGSTDAAPLRQMSDGTDKLGYSLFSDSGRSITWGNTAGTGVAGTGSGVNQNITVYGRINAGQHTPAASASYSDTVTVTVTFS